MKQNWNQGVFRESVTITSQKWCTRSHREKCLWVKNICTR